MSKVIRTDIPLLIIFFSGIVLIASYFFPITQLSLAEKELSRWGIILNAWAMGLGATSLYRWHVGEIIKKTPGRWMYSVWLIIVMSVFIVVGFVWTPSHRVFVWLGDAFYLPIEAAMNALLAFFILTASHRALRARGWEAAILLLAACILTMTNAPIGEAIWGGIPVIGKWILDIPNTAASRGMIICVAVGTIALSIRTLLGYERTQVGVQ